MTKSQTKGTRFGLALLGTSLLLGIAPAVAQERPSQALPRHLKSLGANPQSLSSLIGAGQSALALGDAQAALTFFGRAEELSPRDGRIKMWIGSALVHLQQPQGALKFFEQAIGLGAPEAQVAGERGLAYDVSGDARRAQRDYRLALQASKDPEVTRRLALSLAISGEREPALRLLDDQLRLRDPAAERTRAFVLALTGDSAGAARAVQAAMPGRGAALTPFLERLPGLNASERALAVHFGVFPQSGRSAGPLPNSFASADPVAAGATDPRQAGLGRTPDPRPRGPNPSPRGPDPRPRGDVQTASRQPPKPAATGKTGERVTWSSTSRSLAATERPRAESAPPPQSVAAAARAPAAGQPAPSAATGSAQQLATARLPAAQLPGVRSVGEATVGTTASPATTVLGQQSVLAASTPSAPQSAPPAAVIVAAEPPPAARAANEPAVRPIELAQSTVASSNFSIAAQAPASASAQGTPAPAAEGTSSSRLAEVAATVAALPDPAPRADTPAVKPAAAAARKGNAPAPSVEKRAPAARPAPAKPAPSRTADGKDEKATTPAKAPVKKAAAEPAAKKAPAEPVRVWVQVAGGAEKAALPREFARLKTRAPKLLAARSAWTAPAKATNRLLVGPFKTEKDAQEFVNELAKSKLEGFAWTSEAGQKIEKLPAK